MRNGDIVSGTKCGYSPVMIFVAQTTQGYGPATTHEAASHVHKSSGFAVPIKGETGVWKRTLDGVAHKTEDEI